MNHDYPIVPIRTGNANAYLVVNGSHALLIDTGPKNQEHKILAALSDLRLPPESLQLIILTHTHFDHCGSLRALQKMTHAKVLVHEAEAACLRQGYGAFPNGTRWFSKIIVALGRRFARSLAAYPAVTPDIVIWDSFALSDYGVDGYILPTPGHTAGSISVILHNTQAVVGDTLFHVAKNSVFPPFADGQAELFRSWQKLLDTGCKLFYPGHGTSIERALLRASLLKRQEKAA
jgi:hydroxyacylglutathione hydrolase